MEATEFETDELLKLLTEALRRGPGSPEWHDAVERLNRDGVSAGDERRLLLAVRERLESGQEYREVRAGPGFTRELLARIDEEGAARRGRPVTAVVVALLCVLVLAGSIAVIVSFVSSGSNDDEATQRLASQLFSTPIQQWTFGSATPDDLELTGALKLDAAGGLRVARARDDTYPVAGTLVWRGATSIEQGRCVEAQIQFAPRSDVRPALLVLPVAKDGPEFSLTLDETGFLLTRGDETLVIQRSLQPGAYTLRLKLTDGAAIAEVNGQTVWSGPSPISGQIRAGIRMTRTGKGPGDVRVETLRVLAP